MLKILDSCFEELKPSIQGSMNLIKDDLKKLGIKHDNFFRVEIVKKDLVNKSIKILKTNDYVEEGYLAPKAKYQKSGKTKRLVLNQHYLEMIQIEIKKMMDHGHILQTISHITQIKLIENIII